jgi:hypothetical protein
VSDRARRLVHQPTVIVNLPMSCRTNQEEIFGPVVTITPFKTENEAVAMANATPYGLAATLWTENLNRAHRVADRIEAGTVWVNCWMLRDLRVPFGGVKASGVGRRRRRRPRFFTESKNVCVKHERPQQGRGQHARAGACGSLPARQARGRLPLPLRHRTAPARHQGHPVDLRSAGAGRFRKRPHRARRCRRELDTALRLDPECYEAVWTAGKLYSLRSGRRAARRSRWRASTPIDVELKVIAWVGR